MTWYSVAIHRGITRYAYEAGWALDGGFVRSTHFAQQWRGDGVITVFGVQPVLDESIQALGIPVVNVGYTSPSPRIPCVCADVGMIGQVAAEHFLSRGFRNIAYYQAQDSPGDRMHREAFVRAVEARQQSVHVLGPMKTYLQDRGISEAELHQVLGDMLVALPKPVGVFAEYDDRAIAVMDAAVLRRLRVPEHVAVLGADNDELRCPFAPVPLSSVDNDEERIGYEAAKLLDRMMDGQPPPNEPIHIAPRGVIVRQSTNLLAIPHEHVARALRIIWQHYTEPIDATRVADQIPLSYPQLHASFVRYVGHSMAEELARRRIEHAQRLLAETDLKMTEVAEASGFGSADRMGRIFMRHLKTTPSAYRERHLLREPPGDSIPDETEPVPAVAKPALLKPAERSDGTSPSGPPRARDRRVLRPL